MQSNQSDQDPKELNNTERNGRESFENDVEAPENSAASVNVEKCIGTSIELEEAHSVDQTSVMASVELTIRNDCTSHSNLIKNSVQNNADDELKTIEEQSHSKTPLSSNLKNDTSTRDDSDIKPLKSSLVCNDESPSGHYKMGTGRPNLSIEELTKTKSDEATLIGNMASTEDGRLKRMEDQDSGEGDKDPQVLQNNKSTDQQLLSVKVEDIPLPDSNAEELLERKDYYVAEQDTMVGKYSPNAFKDTKTRGLEEKIDHYLSEYDCPEEMITVSDVVNPEESDNSNILEDPSFSVEATSNNISQDNPPKQEIPPVLNKDLLKAVKTQLVNDYPNLLSNPDYLKKLAEDQTLLLQSYLDQKTNPQTGAQDASLKVSPHNMGSVQKNIVPVPATQESNCSLNPAERTSSEFVKLSSPSSSRSNSPVQFLQPSNINQTMNSFPVRPARTLTATNFISQPNMLPHSQQMLLKPVSPYVQAVPISNSTYQQQYCGNSNSFQNPYNNRPIFVNAQNSSGLYPLRQQHPMVPPSAPSNTNQTQTGPPFSNHVAPYPTQIQNCSSAINIQSSSKLINKGISESANGSDSVLPEKHPLKEQSPPLSIKSYLVQKDKSKSTRRKNLSNTNGATGEEDSQSMDTSSETLHSASFSNSEISENTSNQQSSKEKGTLEMNTLDHPQSFSSFAELNYSGYMSDCNIGAKVKRNSSMGYLRNDNTGYMSDSGFKSIPKTSNSPGFQYKNTDPTVTTAALLSGASGFQKDSTKAHGVPSLLSLSFKPDIVQRFPNPKDSTTNIYKQEPVKTFVQQPEVLHTRSEKKSTDVDLKRRKRNKTTSDISKPSENKPLPMFQTNSNQDDWDLEADPYPTTFKFKADAQKSLNFGTNASNLCTFANQAVQPNPSSVPKKVKKAGLKSEAKINTQFLGRLLKSTESSNERKNSKAIRQAQAMTANIEESDEEEVDEWQTVPKKIKKAKPEVVLPPPKPSGKKKRTVKEDAAFTKLIELMTARIPNTNRDDAIYIIGEIRKKKGTLKGIPLKNIIEMGTTIMLTKDKKDKITTSSKVQVQTCFAKDVPPRFKRIMEPTVTEFSLPKSHEEGDVCVICCDELSAERTKALDCGHEFHIMCINEWVYKHERTCPTCRQIALFPEEFPSLGAG